MPHFAQLQSECEPIPKGNQSVAEMAKGKVHKEQVEPAEVEHQELVEAGEGEKG